MKASLIARPGPSRSAEREADGDINDVLLPAAHERLPGQLQCSRTAVLDVGCGRDGNAISEGDVVSGSCNQANTSFPAVAIATAENVLPGIVGMSLGWQASEPTTGTIARTPNPEVRDAHTSFHEESGRSAWEEGDSSRHVGHVKEEVFNGGGTPQEFASRPIRS